MQCSGCGFKSKMRIRCLIALLIGIIGMPSVGYGQQQADSMEINDAVRQQANQTYMECMLMLPQAFDCTFSKGNNGSLVVQMLPNERMRWIEQHAKFTLGGYTLPIDLSDAITLWLSEGLLLICDEPVRYVGGSVKLIEPHSSGTTRNYDIEFPIEKGNGLEFTATAYLPERLRGKLNEARILPYMGGRQIDYWSCDFLAEDKSFNATYWKFSGSYFEKAVHSLYEKLLNAGVEKMKLIGEDRLCQMIFEQQFYTLNDAIPTDKDTFFVSITFSIPTILFE